MMVDDGWWVSDSGWFVVDWWCVMLVTAGCSWSMSTMLDHLRPIMPWLMRTMDYWSLMMLSDGSWSWRMVSDFHSWLMIMLIILVLFRLCFRPALKMAEEWLEIGLCHWYSRPLCQWLKIGLFKWLVEFLEADFQRCLRAFSNPNCTKCRRPLSSVDN